VFGHEETDEKLQSGSRGEVLSKSNMTYSVPPPSSVRPGLHES
jgi:hypothetical protein